MRRARELAVLALWSVAANNLACGKSEAELEAERVAAAIGRMRDAPRAERGPLIEALASLQPQGERARAAQRACLKAYRGLEAAHAALDEVQAAIVAATESDQAADPALLGKLVAAEEQLTRAQGDQAGCAAEVAVLLRSLR
ncbi:MAG TPA: hypothetical protein ENK57_00850 [Polyangiaceae bacterium]|nr:hypothetical protein [Polyangiaceae bacterium]